MTIPSLRHEARCKSCWKSIYKKCERSCYLNICIVCKRWVSILMCQSRRHLLIGYSKSNNLTEYCDDCLDWSHGDWGIYDGAWG